MEENVPEAEKANKEKSFRTRVLVLVSLVILIAVLNYNFSNKPPSNFPVGSEVEVSEGLSKKQIAFLLEEQNVVRSAFLLTLILNGTYGEVTAKAGVYIFATPLTTTEVASRIISGDQNVAYKKITFPEGFATKDFASFLPEGLTASTTEDISAHEGFLFPDTYFLPKNATVDELISMMQTNFKDRILNYQSAIEASEYTLEEIITFASLVEREAKDTESKKIVAGILQNRLEIGMPLQVDAVFDYLWGKESTELTQDDLATDNPYNTYVYRGLPPGPIANPGTESIEAVLYPTVTNYMYYLTAPDGTFYYATTFDEHKVNKQKYLR